MLGAMGTILQTAQVMRVVTLLPPIEGLWADIKVTAGKPSIGAAGVIVIKPLKPLPGFPG